MLATNSVSSCAKKNNKQHSFNRPISLALILVFISDHSRYGFTNNTRSIGQFAALFSSRLFPLSRSLNTTRFRPRFFAFTVTSRLRSFNALVVKKSWSLALGLGLAVALTLSLSFFASRSHPSLTDTLPTLTLYWFHCLTVVTHVVPRSDPHLQTYDRERVG